MHLFPNKTLKEDNNLWQPRPKLDSDPNGIRDSDELDIHAPSRDQTVGVSKAIEINSKHKELLTRIKTRELCTTTRQLATLLRSGMPMVPALSALIEQLQGRALSRIIRDVHDRVNDGETLAQALSRHPYIFSELYVNLVKVGETSGTLENVLLRLAQVLEKRANLNSKVKATVAYPLLMGIVAVGVVIFLMAFVIPSLTKIFLDMNRALPWPTELLIAVSAFIKTHLVAMLITAAVIILSLVAYMNSTRGKLTWDRAKLKLPLFGDLHSKIEASRLTRTLGIMLAAGVSILEAMTTVKGVVQNSFIAAKLDEAKDALGRGDTIAHAIRNTGLFGPVMYHTIAIGEMSGNVEEQLLSIADTYDEEVELSVRTLVALLEPALLLAMGTVLGFIVLAVLLPIFEINQIV